jgi:CBS domain containing-hemolysin-like protein
MLGFDLSIVLLLIVLNGFFAMAEIALVSARNGSSHSPRPAMRVRRRRSI